MQEPNKNEGKDEPKICFHCLKLYRPSQAGSAKHKQLKNPVICCPHCGGCWYYS